MKACTKCNQQKAAEEFFRDSQKKDGLSSGCKACYKAYYSVIRDHKLKTKKAYREKNAVPIAAYRAVHYAKNRDRALECATRWRGENPVRRRAAENARRARKNNSVGQFTAEDLEKILAAQKWKCACCRKCIKSGYHADHIQPLSRGGSNDRLNIQALCPGCNMSKKAKEPHHFMQSRGYLL
ncbi:HNH endonuclease [Pseudomonas ficuserectae]|uniref:HNH endonuclease n=1 Tax=Pseudomonas syringae group genomosp. 2 TaxID=251698 RepID=UPI00069AD237|nr:HNH endonuclease [Pseudomonas amygdali]WIO56280.1 HNH endonuclease [Pseudomonas amygdali pv. lachrymans]